MTERLWPAGIAALTMHSLMIAAFALGIHYPQGSSPQDFHVEVMFESNLEKGAGELITSPLVGEVDSERSDESGEGCLSRKPRHQRVNPLVHKISKSFQKTVGKETGLLPSPSSGGQPSGDAHDAFPLYNPPPIYPIEARRKRLQGVVTVRLSLTETGTVDKATTLPPRIDPLLEDAALTAIHQWRFKPGVRTVEVPIEFKLEA